MLGLSSKVSVIAYKTNHSDSIFLNKSFEYSNSKKLE